ncbi:hypothetical protein [Spirosoma endbachense]|uniref:Uncharacterized protein n=1 Tax=Spirosoma endbachense TaxID=2666025 RepID=A0A6P1W7C0_9BACT|nr:hypothetical protein [Spirosoma endbachense]QHW00916.1 hypothetical protein GJR95_40395 [Spirosoma endbachense]
MKTIICAFLAIVVGSCISPSDYSGRDSIDIYIENQTGTDLISVKVFVVQSTQINGKYQNTRIDSGQIGTIANMKTAKGTLFENKILGIDGSYQMTALGKNGKSYSYQFGYLTNGAFLETAQYLTVKKDTILTRRL